MPMSPAPRWRSLAGRRTALLLLLTPSAACRTWRAEPLPPAGAPARPLGAHARATRADGSRVELLAARVERDTVRGQLYGNRGAAGPVGVPVDSLRRLEVRRVSRARTTALGLGAGALLAALAVMLTPDADDYSFR